MEDRPPAGRAEAERRNLHTVALLIARAALAREESRGAHKRIDFPDKAPRFEKHSRMERSRAEVVYV
jgi:L-aspartate oxidase